MSEEEGGPSGPGGIGSQIPLKNTDKTPYAAVETESSEFVRGFMTAKAFASKSLGIIGFGGGSESDMGVEVGGWHERRRYGR